MNKCDVYRKIDSMCRVTIPCKICKLKNWYQGKKLYCLCQEDDEKIYIFENINDFEQKKTVLQLQTRLVDNVNRIVLPIQILNILSLKPHDKIHIYYENNYVVLEKNLT